MVWYNNTNTKIAQTVITCSTKNIFSWFQNQKCNICKLYINSNKYTADILHCNVLLLHYISLVLYYITLHCSIGMYPLDRQRSCFQK